MKEGKKRKADKTKSSTVSVSRKPPPPSRVPEPPKTKSKKKKTKEDKQKENLNEVASVKSTYANLNAETSIRPPAESNISEESAKTGPPQYKPEPPKVKSKSKSSLMKKEKKPKKQSSKRKNNGEYDKKLLPDESDSSKDKTKATPNAEKNSEKNKDPIYYDPVSFSRVPQRPETSAISSKASNVSLSDRHESNEVKEDAADIASSGTNWGFLRVVARMSKRGSKSKQRSKIGSSDGMDKSLSTNIINSNSKEMNASSQELVNSVKIDGFPKVTNKKQNLSAEDQVIDNGKSKKKLKRNSGNKPKAVSKVKSYPLETDSQTDNKGNDNRPVSEIIETHSAKDAELDEGDAKKKSKKKRSSKKDRQLLSATKSVPLATKNASESPRDSKRPVSEIVQGNDNTLNPSLTGSKPSFVLSNESLASFSRRKSNLTASFRKKMRKLSGRQKADTETGKDGIVDAPAVDQDSDSKTTSIQPDVNANVNLDGENGVKGVETDVVDVKTKKKKARPDVPQRPKGVLELKAATTAVAGMKAVKEKPVVPPRPAGAIETLEVDTKTEPEMKKKSKKKKKSSKRKETLTAASKQKNASGSSPNNNKKNSSIDFRAATKVVMAVEKARPAVPPRPTLTVDKDSTDRIEVDNVDDKVDKTTGEKITLGLKENTSEETKKNAAKISKFSWFTAKLRGRQKARKEEDAKINEKEAPKDLKIKPASSSVDLTDESPPSSQEKVNAAKKIENYDKDVQNTTPSKTIDASKSVQISKSGSPTKTNEIKLEPQVSKKEDCAVSSTDNPNERQVMRIPSIHVTPTAKRKKKDRQSFDGDDGKLSLTTRAKGEMSSEYLKHLFVDSNCKVLCTVSLLQSIMPVLFQAIM